MIRIINLASSSLAFPSIGVVSPQMLESGHLKFVYKVKDSFFYTSSLCTEMNKKYGHLYVDIREREQEVCDRLMEHVYERLYDIHRAINYCAQIDCLMAMASFSLVYELVRPDMVAGRKVLEIKVRTTLKCTN